MAKPSLDIASKVRKHTKPVGSKTWYDKLSQAHRDVADQFIQYAIDHPREQLSAIARALSEEIGVSIRGDSFRRMVSDRREQQPGRAGK